MEDTPNTAAADATVKSQETTNEAPAEQVAETKPAAPTANIPEANIEEFNKFVSGQGGFDKAFAKWKDMVSNPQKKEEPVKQQEPEQKTQEQAPTTPQEKVVPKGYITPEEYMTEQYFKSLANEEKYSEISEQIRSGEVLKEMAEFGIKPTQDGMFNDGQIRKFLDLKAQTVPAKQTTAPITNTPTVEWSNYEKVDSFESAQKIIQENLLHPGMEHPKTAEAKEFLKGFYK